MADWHFWALMSAIFWVSLRVEAVNDRLGDVQREQRTLSATVKAIEPGYMRERMVKIPTADGGTRAKSYGCLTAKGVGMCASRYCRKGE